MICRSAQFWNCPDCFRFQLNSSKSPNVGLYKLFHPAIPDGRTWSKLENMENIDHMTLYLWFKTPYLWLKTLYSSTRWLKTRHWWRRLQNHYKRARRTLFWVRSKWENIERNVESCPMAVLNLSKQLWTQAVVSGHKGPELSKMFMMIRKGNLPKPSKT